MGKQSQIKTNAMRILDKNKVNYKVNTYNCEEFIDGVHIADMLGQKYDISFKTLVAVGKSGEHYVFAIPVHKELDMKKAAKSVNEKSVELLHVKDINSVTGYIRGGCTPLGMKKNFVTVVDASAEKYPEIIISGGKLGVQIILDPKDLIKVVGGKFQSVTFEKEQ